MKKPLFLTSVVALLCACQANQIPDSSYQYQPKNLTPETKRVIETQYVQERIRDGQVATKVEFDESISALVVTQTLDPGWGWNKATQKAVYATALCEDDTPFYRFIREKGIGIKFVSIDNRQNYKFGPWNQDACQYINK